MPKKISSRSLVMRMASLADQVPQRHCLPSRYANSLSDRASISLKPSQGVAGLSKRDIQLFVDAGYNTVESVAYT